VQASVEVLIVSYDSAAAIATCLASLARTAPDIPVAIREHGPDPAAEDRLRTSVAGHTAPVRLEFDPSNPGFGAGCNALARSSAAEWLLFLNPDTELIEWPWAATEPPRQTVVGATMVDSGRPGAHAGRSYGVADEIARSWFRHRRPPRDGRGFVSGAALLIDAESFRRLRGFDERYFLFYEDIDLCLRANDIGLPTVVADSWKVRHSGGHSTRTRFGQSLIWSYESGVRFHASRGSPAASYRCYVIIDAVCRVLVHVARRDPSRRTAYQILAQRAMRDLIELGDRALGRSGHD
jgi:GT2 family glycosyltransferase